MFLLSLAIILALSITLYMSLWYAFGFLYLKRVDSVDVAWGLGFIYVAVITYFIFTNYSLFPTITLALVSIWGLRLSLHIASRNIKKAEDPRYKVFRDKWTKNLALNVYLRIFLLQGALILIVSSPISAILIGSSFNQPLAFLGFGVWTFGILFESVADYQLRRFLREKKAKNQIMDQGLWRYSRHPNYFGEITAWTGASVVACSAGNFWGLIGPALLAFLIIKISGFPPLEKKYKNDPNYQKYAQKTSVLIPLPSRK